MRFRKLLCRSQTRIDLLFTMSDITHVAVHPDKRVRSDVSRTMFLWVKQSARLKPARLRSSSFDVAAFATIRLA
jgi:hypothetical protein